VTSAEEAVSTKLSNTTQLRDLFLCGDVVVNKRHVLQRTFPAVQHTNCSLVDTRLISTVLQRTFPAVQHTNCSLVDTRLT